jgi:hypothetical protein
MDMPQALAGIPAPTRRSAVRVVDLGGLQFRASLETLELIPLTKSAEDLF